MGLNFLILGELFSLAFLGSVAKAALLTGAVYVLFPELAALAYDVFTRPAGVWARSPLMLAITPAAAAAMGTAVARTMPYDLWSVAICIAGAMLLIRLLRSPVAPAISAAFLPLALGVTSWWYPISIAAVTGVLALLSVIYNRVFASQILQTPASVTDAEDDETGRTPQRYAWLPVLIGFLLSTYGLAAATGLRLILFPPLVVIAFEMFAHADVCPWAQHPFALPLACVISAGAGVGALVMFGAGSLSVAVALLIGITTLRLLRLHIPPALAVGLLPQVMPHADWRFPLAVAIGTLALTASFLLARPLLLNMQSQSMLDAG
jgi:hypothetical protein